MINILLTVVLLAVVPILLGTIWNRILGANENTIPEVYVPGFLLLICIFEATTIFSMKFDMAFSKVVLMNSVLLFILCGGACVFCNKQLQKLLLPKFTVKDKQKKETACENGKSKIYLKEGQIYLISLALLMGMQFLLICHFAPVTKEDTTLEFVQTILSTNTIGMYNPLMGTPFETGPTFQGKILILPVLYSYMIQLFKTNPAVFVYKMVPMWMVLVSYLVYTQLSEGLFQESANVKNRRLCFLLIYSVLLLFGGFFFTTPSYRLLFSGFVGETMVVTLFIPYIISQVLLLYQNKKWILHGGNIALTCVSVIPVMSWRKGVIYIAVLFLMLFITAVIVWIKKMCEKKHEKKCQ